MQIDSKALKSAREARSWSQDELATASGLSVRTIQRAESDGTASLQTLKSLAATLEIDLQSLKLSRQNTAPTSPPDVARTSVQNTGLIPRLIAAMLAAATVAAIALWLGLRPGDSPDAVATSSPVAERMLGRWETNFVGTASTLDIDATAMRSSLGGTLGYLVNGDTITFGYGGQTRIARVTFPARGEMMWQSLQTGHVIGVFYRTMPAMPSAESTRSALLGKWALESGGSLEVTDGVLHLVKPDGTVLHSPYALTGKLLSLNVDPGLVYAVNFHPPNVMSWTRPGDRSQLVFTRAGH